MPQLGGLVQSVALTPVLTAANLGSSAAMSTAPRCRRPCAQVTAPGVLLACLRALVQEDGWPLERALPLFTTNPAARLRLPRKGRARPSPARGAHACAIVRAPGRCEICASAAAACAGACGWRPAMLRARFSCTCEQLLLAKTLW